MQKRPLNSYKEGFIPGPEENEEHFFKRIDLSKCILADPYKYITEKSLAKTTLTPLNGAALLSTGSKNIFIHGSSTIVVEVMRGINFPIINNPSKFSSLFVNREEVMAHEHIHALRAQFEASKYEEILAFSTSPSLFRRTISPIISSNLDLLLFFTSTILCFFSIIPMLSLISYLSAKLYLRLKTVNRCISYLKRHTKSYRDIIVGMTDEEIVSLSRNKPDEIDFSLFRWKYLQELFGSVK